MEQNRKDDSALPGIGAALKSIREAANVSKRQMALEANIQREQLDRIEHGRSACSMRTLVAYLGVCGVDFVGVLKKCGESKWAGKDGESKPRAGRPKGKNRDYSLLPPMEWAWDELEDCWKASEVMRGHLKTYRVWEDGRATMKVGANENEGEKVWNGGMDKESAIRLIDDWRYYDGWQL